MESSSEKKKMTPIFKVTIVFICAAIILTFFSKTIYNAGIPTVYVSKVKSDMIEVKYTGEGVVSPKETTALYASGDFVVTDILVSQYDIVKKGDVLAVFDVSDLENQLLDMQTEYEKLISARKNTSGEARRLMNLDVADMERHMDTLQKQIDNGKELCAPFDGVITEIYANSGMMTNRSSPLFNIGNTEQGYVVKQVIEDDNARYYTKATVYLTGIVTKTKINGEITDRIPAENGEVEITIQLDPDVTELQPDMLVMFQLSGKTENFSAIVPTSAVMEDSYVYKLIETDGPLGTEYRIRRTDVEIQTQTQEYTAVTGELSIDDKVVIRSDRPLSDERVKIAH